MRIAKFLLFVFILSGAFLFAGCSGDISLEEAVTVTKGATEPAVTFDFTD